MGQDSKIQWTDTTWNIVWPERLRIRQMPEVNHG